MLRIVAAITLALMNVSVASAFELENVCHQGDDYLNVWKFEEALAKFQQCLKSSSQQKHVPMMADAYYKIGICDNALAKPADALQALKKAEQLHTKLLDKQAVGNDLIEIAKAEIARANFRDAVAVAEKALKIHQETANRKGEADALRQMGYAHNSMGDYTDALSFSERSLQIASEIGDQQGIAMSKKDIAATQLRQGNYEKALENLEGSAKIAKQIGDKRTLSKALSNMAIIYGEQGDFNREIGNLEAAAKLAEEGEDFTQQCVVFLNTGAVQYESGNYGKSQDIYQKAIALATKIGNKRYLSGALLGSAMVQFQWGSNESGMKYLKKALSLAEKVGDKNTLTYALNELGWYSMEREEHLQALKYFQRAFQVRSEMDDQRGMAASLNYLASIYWKLGKYDQGIESCKQALAIGEPLGIKKEVSSSYEKLAAIYHTKKDMAAAETSIAKAIEISKEISDPEDLAGYLHLRGLIYRDSGRMEDALQSLKESVDVIESIRAEIDLPEEKAGYFEMRQDAYEDVIGILLKANKTSEAFQFAERSKARAFLDMLAEIEIDPFTTEDSALLSKKDKLLKEMVELHQQIDEENGSEKPDKSKIQSLLAKRDQLNQQYTNLIAEIRKQNPQVAEVRYPLPLNMTEAQQLLDDQSVLLEYFVGKKSSTLFAITKDRVESYPLPAEKTLTTRITEIRDALQKPDVALQISEQAHTKFITLASSLYQSLLKPARNMMTGKQRIVIAPDGPLYYVPFESLISDPAKMKDFAKLHYVGADYEIQYVPSASVLNALQKNSSPDISKRKELIALADPALVMAGSREAKVREWAGSLLPLPHAREEADAIANMFPKGQSLVLAGKEASEKNVKTLKLGDYRRIHFASHGLIDEERPQFSSLVLSPDVSAKEDGFLTMPEVFDLKLNADLVVLSACKTGLGKRIRGEGVTGLSRAFLYAGASSVLVSLWNVYDSSTSEFMKSFYSAMEKKHLSKSAALKQARAEMIRSGKYSHPYYWSPFVLIGAQ